MLYKNTNNKNLSFYDETYGDMASNTAIAIAGMINPLAGLALSTGVMLSKALPKDKYGISKNGLYAGLSSALNPLGNIDYLSKTANEGHIGKAIAGSIPVVGGILKRKDELEELNKALNEKKVSNIVGDMNQFAGRLSGHSTGVDKYIEKNNVVGFDGRDVGAEDVMNVVTSAINAKDSLKNIKKPDFLNANSIRPKEEFITVPARGTGTLETKITNENAINFKNNEKPDFLNENSIGNSEIEKDNIFNNIFKKKNDDPIGFQLEKLEQSTDLINNSSVTPNLNEIGYNPKPWQLGNNIRPVENLTKGSNSLYTKDINVSNYDNNVISNNISNMSENLKNFLNNNGNIDINSLTDEDKITLSRKLKTIKL